MNNDLDLPVYGAKAIAEVLNLRDENGGLDLRRTYYAAERGYIDADKFGRRWTSTPRRLLRRVQGSAVGDSLVSPRLAVRASEGHA
jgi:hypothetical protein